MTDDTLLPFDLPAVRRKKLTVDFDGGNQSSDGGLLLLREAERAPVPGVTYRAFVDPSGGSSDSMTLAIAHRDGERAVLDAVRERKPPFSPDVVVQEFAGLLKSYGISSVRGDRYGGEWPRERFHAHGISYEPAAQPKSEIYAGVLPLLNSGRVELLDHPRLVAQLCGLERRTARGGRDSIDHAPGAHDDVANSVAGALLAPSPTGAEAWIDFAKRLAERTRQALEPQDDDDRRDQRRSAPLAQASSQAAKTHPAMPDALRDNPVSRAYWAALGAAENRPAALAVPRCAACGAATLGTRISDGVRAWCDLGCQHRWTVARAERNRSRALAENGRMPPNIGGHEADT